MQLTITIALFGLDHRKTGWQCCKKSQRCGLCANLQTIEMAQNDSSFCELARRSGGKNATDHTRYGRTRASPRKFYTPHMQQLSRAVVMYDARALARNKSPA